MKRFILKGIILGRVESRTDDEFILNLPKAPEVRPAELRWFRGVDDLKTGLVPQML